MEKYSNRTKSDSAAFNVPENVDEKKSRRRSDLMECRMSQILNKTNEDTGTQRKISNPPKKRQSSDIAGLLSKLDKKFNSSQFTDEVHLKPGDPGYGKPKEGTKTAARGRKAHSDISEEIVRLCEVIWDHAKESGGERS